jgi:thioredoxin-like negative regulator of GroEL
MTTILCATIVQAALALGAADVPASPASSADSYAEAYRTTEKTGKPIVIMVSTEWCQPCQVMKRSILPRVRQRGLLRKVAFAVVNPDRDGELAEKITGGGPVPQLVMFRKTPHGWMRRKLIGGQTVEAVEEFINEGLASDKADKKKDEEKGKEKGNEKGKEAPSSGQAAAHRGATAEGDDSARHG